MSKIASWFRSSTTTPAATPGGSKVPSSTSLASASKDEKPISAEAAFRATKKAAELQDALTSVSLMMDDDIDGANAALAKGDSPFHLLGLGLTLFMRSVMGFEKEVMAEASAKLYECESKAWSELRAAQKKGERHSDVYEPGTEYALLAAESQLMSAVVSVLHESLTEAVKGFYKLRKAYVALDAIVQAERKGLADRPAIVAPPLEEEDMPGTFDEEEFAELHPKKKKEEETTVAVVNGETKKNEENAGLGSGSLEKDLEKLKVEEAGKSATTTTTTTTTTTESSPARPGTSSSSSSAPEFTNPLDIFIYSGTNMCFGLLHLLISMVPPAMSRLLSIIGFTGDRACGVRMLWNATRFHNINGAVSGLVLLAYYNGLLGTADILPPNPPSSSPETNSDDELYSYDAEREVIGIPREKCAALLAEMSARFPGSRLWRLEEARGLGQSRRLRDAIGVLTTGPDAKMRQVAALNAFELSLDSMFAQDWALHAEASIRCLELNDWSHCLYYYLSGCAELELYRDAVAAGDEAEARRKKARVDELWKKAPTVAGRKKFMSRPLPFEVFVQRKLEKYEARAKAFGVSLPDAAGVSPALEMAALWCGPKRMDPTELEKMRAGMAWERCTAGEENVAKMKSDPDECAVRAVHLADVLRLEGRLEEAKALLKEGVLCYDRTLLKGGLKDDYSWPLAQYQLGVIAYEEACDISADNLPTDSAEETKGDDAARKTKARELRLAKLDECQSYLDLLVQGEAYLLDARMGMRVQTGIETLKWFRGKLSAN